MPMKPWPFALRNPDVEFVTALSQDDCEKRLFDLPDRAHRIPFLVERPVTRWIGNGDFYLTRHSTIQWRNQQEFSDTGLVPVFYCRLREDTLSQTHVIAKLGYYLPQSRFLAFPIAVWLVGSIGLGLALLTGQLVGSIEAAMLIMTIPFIALAGLGLAYLRERTHLKYLTTYLRQVLLDPSVDPNLSQFSHA